MAADAPIPSRVRVVLFTDVVGSTDLKTRLGAAGYLPLLERHNALFEQVCEQVRGARIIKHTGDGFLTLFESAADAVRVALLFQAAMRKEPWEPVTLQTRVGIHSGELAEVEMAGQADVSGLAADLAARVMSLARGGQVLLTRWPFDDARQFLTEHPAGGDGSPPPPPLLWLAHGRYLFKGNDEPVEVFEVGAEGLAPLVAPPDGEKVKRVVPHDQEQTLGWRPAIGLEVDNRCGWVLQRKLGEGGFGEVWLAQSARTKERRVFKFCFDANRLRSFKRALTLFRLLRDVLGERSDIARLYDVKLDKPPFYLESEYAPGGNLREWADGQGGVGEVPLAARLLIIADVAEALSAAHSVGVLHKDVKPSNVLMKQGKEGQPTPVLADFGIGLLTDRGQLAQRQITETGFTLITENDSSRTGTRMYTPPELLAGRPFTVQGDVYSLGVLLYQMTVGDLSKPLAGGWERDVTDELLRDDIAACVDGDPAKRPLSAAEVAERIRRLPDRRKERHRIESAARRKRVLWRAGALGGVLSVLSLILAVTFTNWRKAEQQAAMVQRDRLERMRDLRAVSRNTQVAAFDLRSHPRFGQPWRNGVKGQWTDPTRLRFNHALHLRINGGNISQCSLCHSTSISEIAWDKNGVAFAAFPVFGDDVASSTFSVAARDQRYMQPISFDRHCKQCHELELPDRVSITHADMASVRAQVSNLAQFHFTYLASVPGEQRKDFLNSKTEDEWVKDGVSTVTKAVNVWARGVAASPPDEFRSQYEVLETVLPRIATYPPYRNPPPVDLNVLELYIAYGSTSACGKCHELEGVVPAIYIYQMTGQRRSPLVEFNRGASARRPGSDATLVAPTPPPPPAVAPVVGPPRPLLLLQTIRTGIPKTPRRWLIQSHFNHAFHRQIQCVDCHATAITSVATSDMLLPDLDVCVKCHSPSAGLAVSQCSLCHLFED